MQKLFNNQRGFTSGQFVGYFDLSFYQYWGVGIDHVSKQMDEQIKTY